MEMSHLTNSFLDNFLLGTMPSSIATSVLGYLVAAGLIGKILRRPWLEGQSIGLLILAAGSGVALYLTRWLGVSIDFFGILSIAFIVGLVAILKATAFCRPYPGQPAGPTVWYAFGFLTLIIWGVRILMPYPAAAYSIYQAWNPLYLDSSFQQNLFLLEQHMAQGSGFMTTGNIAYAVEGLGLAALNKWIFGVQSFPATNAYSVAAVIAAVGILLFGLRRNIFAVLAFALMFLVFYRHSSSFGVVTKNDWDDTALFLGGTTAMYYMVTGEAGRTARFGAAFASSMMVISRSYGAVYSAFIGLLGFSADVKARIWKRNFLGWVAYAFVLGALSFREMFPVVFNRDVFQARFKMMEIHPRSFDKTLFGTLGDWGIVPDTVHFNYPVPIILPAVLMLLVLIYMKGGWRGHRLKAFAIVLSPFMLLLAPLGVELLTGFRKGLGFSKLYVVSIFFFSWYPCWLLSRVQLPPFWRTAASRLELLSKVGGPALIVIIALGVVIKYDAITKWYQHATEVYLSSDTDVAIARGLKDTYRSPAEWQCIVDRPVMYFYYEPGLGLRSFIGGDVFKDYDFWSDDVQGKLEKSERFESIVENLGYPNLYYSFPMGAGYSEWMETDASLAYLDEIKNFSKMTYVRVFLCNRARK